MSNKSAIALENRLVAVLLHICDPWQRHSVCHTVLQGSCGHTSLMAPQVLVLYIHHTKSIPWTLAVPILVPPQSVPLIITQLKKTLAPYLSV